VSHILPPNRNDANRPGLLSPFHWRFPHGWQEPSCSMTLGKLAVCQNLRSEDHPLSSQGPPKPRTSRSASASYSRRLLCYRLSFDRRVYPCLGQPDYHEAYGSSFSSACDLIRI